MFDGAAKFNQNIGTWDTSKVKSMVGMLANTAYFDRELRNWDTSSVTSMEDMFRNAKKI
jgi:surface protein